MPTLTLSTLRRLAEEFQLSLVAVTSSEPLETDRERLQQWQGEGYAGELGYMLRDPELLTAPQRIEPSTVSVPIFGISYDQGRVDECPPGFGRVARYAWGRDYHRVIRKQLERLCSAVEKEIGSPIIARIFTDSVPLLERALASRAGLGFVGKNTLLIVPGHGSFLFLAEILWNVEVVNDEPMGHEAQPKANCGSCHRCLTGCPTGAFVSPYILDARKCISYLTIEKRGALSIQERGWLGEWIFGCDVCQEVCPFNHVAMKRNGRASVAPLRAEYGVGSVLSLQDVLRIRSHGEFVGRFGGTAVARAKREGLLRNAAVVAANTCAVPLLHDLIETAKSDAAGVVRQHCLWAAVSLARLSGSKAVEDSLQLAQFLARDQEEAVRLEAVRVLSGDMH